jgi:two-component system sensor histidine kinase EvgS
MAMPTCGAARPIPFPEHPYPTTAASILAVCHHEADLVMVFGGARHRRCPAPALPRPPRSAAAPPCWPDAPASGCHGRCANSTAGSSPSLKAGPTPAGCTRITAGPAAQLPDRHAAGGSRSRPGGLAIGLEPTLRPGRRHFNGSLRLQPFDSGFSTDLTCWFARKTSNCWAHRTGIAGDHTGGACRPAPPMGRPDPARRGRECTGLDAVAPPRGWLLLAPLIALPLLWRTPPAGARQLKQRMPSA